MDKTSRCLVDMSSPAAFLGRFGSCLSFTDSWERESSLGKRCHLANPLRGISSFLGVSSLSVVSVRRRQCFPSFSSQQRKKCVSATRRQGVFAESGLQSKEREEQALGLSCPVSLREEQQSTISMQDSVSFVVFVAAGAVLSYACYPTLLQVTRGSEPLTSDVRNYVGQVSSTTSLMFAILLGNTYSFIQGRLKDLLQATMTEVLAVQRLMDEAMLESSVRREWSQLMLVALECYFIQEIPTATVARSGLAVSAESAAFNEIMHLALELSKCDVATRQPLNLLSSAQQLGQSRCVRLSASECILPSLHWVILITLAVICALAFPLMDPESVVNNHSMQRYLFATVITTVSVTLFVLVDFAYPLDGLYGISSMPNLAGVISCVWKRLRQNRDFLG